MVNRLQRRLQRRPSPKGQGDSYRKEVARKLFHAGAMLGTVLASAFIFQVYGMDMMKQFLLAVLVLVLVTEWLVIDIGMYVPIYRELERANERHRMHGSAYCLIGALLAIEFFSLRIAFVATMMVALTDVVTGLIGRKWGRHKLIGPKTIEGTLSGLLVNLLIGTILLPSHIGIAMAVTATVVEASVNIVDDNLAVPVMAGFVGQMLLYHL